MKDEGVEVFACKACADLYGVSEKLEEIGLEVKYIGKDLSQMLQSGWTHLTFWRIQIKGEQSKLN